MLLIHTPNVREVFGYAFISLQFSQCYILARQSNQRIFWYEFLWVSWVLQLLQDTEPYDHNHQALFELFLINFLFQHDYGVLDWLSEESNYPRIWKTRKKDMYPSVHVSYSDTYPACILWAIRGCPRNTNHSPQK